MKLYYFFLLLFLMYMPVRVCAADGLQVSLLTVEPRANRVYTVYGHTALRLCDVSQEMDVVLNWGMFDFQAPHFLYRFIRGETDYFLSGALYEEFIESYREGNATVREQWLDLSEEGKEWLLAQLAVNLLPENRMYRYNFLFDNCTTRVRNLIEGSAPGLTYPAAERGVSFRELIHSCTEPYAWMTFGIDLLIGCGADSVIGVREALFLPMGLSEVLEGSVVASRGGAPVVLRSEQVLTGMPEETGRWGGLSPVMVGYGLLVVLVAGVVMGRRCRRWTEWGFALLFLAAGAAGCLLGFMGLFSLHPCVSGNWNLLWLHPLQLVGSAGFVWGRRLGRRAGGGVLVYQGMNMVVLVGLLVMWRGLPQVMHPAGIPLVLGLVLGAGYWIGCWRRGGMRTDQGKGYLKKTKAHPRETKGYPRETKGYPRKMEGYQEIIQKYQHKIRWYQEETEGYEEEMKKYQNRTRRYPGEMK
jgi:hypothetical protein